MTGEPRDEIDGSPWHWAWMRRRPTERSARSEDAEQGINSVPEICRFFGIVVTMYYDDHAPPHFHAKYGATRVVIGLSDLTVLRGGLPPRALGLLMEWAVQHREELEENWTMSRSKQPLKSIAPLE